MSIVRSLLTKLSFKVDKSGIESFEKSIVGFKTKIAAVSAAISAAVYKTADYFSGVAKAINDTANLAKNTETAIKDVVALRRAFESLGVPTEKFNAYFENIGKILYEARSGKGKLFDILNKSGKKLNLTDFIQTGDIRGALLETVDYINSLKDQQAKLRAIEDIFNDTSGNEFLRAAEATRSEIVKREKDNERFAETYATSTDSAKKFHNSLIELKQEFGVLTTELSIYALPILKQATEGITEFIKEINKVGVTRAAAKAVTPTLQKINDNPLSRATRPISDFFVETGKSIVDFFYDNKPSINSLKPQAAGNTYQITNDINIEVAPGTPEEQKVDMSVEMRATMQSFWDEQVRQLVANNPQVE